MEICRHLKLDPGNKYCAYLVCSDEQPALVPAWIHRGRRLAATTAFAAGFVGLAVIGLAGPASAAADGDDRCVDEGDGDGWGVNPATGEGCLRPGFDAEGLCLDSDGDGKGLNPATNEVCVRAGSVVDPDEEPVTTPPKRPFAQNTSGDSEFEVWAPDVNESFPEPEPDMSKSFPEPEPDMSKSFPEPDMSKSIPEPEPEVEVDYQSEFAAAEEAGTVAFALAIDNGLAAETTDDPKGMAGDGATSIVDEADEQHSDLEDESTEPVGEFGELTENKDLPENKDEDASQARTLSTSHTDRIAEAEYELVSAKADIVQYSDNAYRANKIFNHALAEHYDGLAAEAASRAMDASVELWAAQRGLQKNSFGKYEDASEVARQSEREAKEAANRTPIQNIFGEFGLTPRAVAEQAEQANDEAFERHSLEKQSIWRLPKFFGQASDVPDSTDAWLARSYGPNYATDGEFGPNPPNEADQVAQVQNELEAEQAKRYGDSLAKEWLELDDRADQPSQWRDEASEELEKLEGNTTPSGIARAKNLESQVKIYSEIANKRLNERDYGSSEYPLVSPEAAASQAAEVAKAEQTKVFREHQNSEAGFKEESGTTDSRETDSQSSYTGVTDASRKSTVDSYEIGHKGEFDMTPSTPASESSASGDY